MFNQVYEKTHPVTVTPVKVRLVVDCVNNRGAATLEAIMLPPYT